MAKDDKKTEETSTSNADAPPAPPPPAPPPPVATATAGAPRFIVAKGRSLTCKRGVISEGEEIRAMDLGGALNLSKDERNTDEGKRKLGAAQLEQMKHLVAKGYVVAA